MAPLSKDPFYDTAPSAEPGIFAPDLHDTHHLWLKAVLLAVWVVVSFGLCFFAHDLQQWLQVSGLGYWMAAQGAVLMFLLIVVVYCVAMDQFERNDHRSASSAAEEALGTPHGPTP